MTEAEKVAEAMAKAMGVTIVKDDQPADNTDNNADPNDGKTDETEPVVSDDGKNDLSQGSGQGNADGGQTPPDTSKKLPTSSSVETDFDKVLADRSKGKFKSFDDIEKALSTLPADSFATDEVAKINDYVKNGGNIDDFVRTQRTDYTKKSDIDVLREAERLADPMLSEEDITLLLESQYGVAENASDKEKRLKEIQIKRDAVVARQKLVEHQKQWAVPTVSPEVAAAEAKRWSSALNSTADKIEKLDIKLNETESFSYVVPKELRSKVAKENENLATFFKRYLNEDGTENIEKFVKDMVILDNFNEIVKSAAGFSKSKGKVETIKDIKNTDFQSKDRGAQGTSAKSIAQQAAEQIFRK